MNCLDFQRKIIRLWAETSRQEGVKTAIYVPEEHFAEKFFEKKLKFLKHFRNFSKKILDFQRKKFGMVVQKNVLAEKDEKSFL